ncbi:RUN and FYVE domain-containing protein 2-like isoform X1 [Centruroides vittatus]|uniref:RUN and FYVE domain-containing protein 2-like isoform X1 n=1 Tax=Centruroides vittatus TaxID=120091 RepID=UPI0035100C74
MATRTVDGQNLSEREENGLSRISSTTSFHTENSFSDLDNDDSVKEKSLKSNEEKWPTLFISKTTFSQIRKSKQKRDPVAIERSNLVNVTKLVVKELIESSLKYGRMLDSDHVPLQHFFILLEHVLRHGLKPKKGLLGPRKELWNMLQLVENYMPEASDITASVRDLPTVKTQLGRTRAWLRLALMQKRLADYFRFLVDKKDEILAEFYEDESLMMSEEAVVIGGLLVGLNVIDCNLCVKEEDLDSQQGIIDFSLYLRDNNHEVPPEGVESASMTAVLDQKNYIEELNRHLNATVTNLQQKVEHLQTTNALMKEDLAIAKNQILSLQDENSILQRAQEHLTVEHRRKLDEARADMSAERETYHTNQAGLDSLYNDIKKQLQEEIQNKQDLEQELELQGNLRREAEMAMKLLEKDIHEKQDTIVSLRRQLEDIKAINLQMYNKLQECEVSVKQKNEQIELLEKNTNKMTEVLKDLENKLNQVNKQRKINDETIRKLGQQLAEKDQSRAILESDLKIEREWRMSLQSADEDQKNRIADLQHYNEQLQTASLEHQRLKDEYKLLEKKCAEHEMTLEEIGTQLKESRLEVEDLKESHLSLKEAVWTRDKEASSCKQCNKLFSVARRKHHCRHCGEIFCNTCSDNTMPLPSSAKPLRVCDNCYTLLLQRYSAS